MVRLRARLASPESDMQFARPMPYPSRKRWVGISSLNHDQGVRLR